MDSEEQLGVPTTPSSVYWMKKDQLIAYLKEEGQAVDPAANVTLLRKQAVQYIRTLATDNSSSEKELTQVSPQRDNLFMKALEHVPLLHSLNPHEVLKFFVATDRLYDMHLVSEIYFLQSLLIKTTDFALECLTQHLKTGANYVEFKKRVLEFACPKRVYEQCKIKYVMRFQEPHESFHDFVQSVVNHHRALNMNLAEEELVETILDNVSPLTKQHFPPCALPCNLKGLYELTIKVEASLRTTSEYLLQHPPVVTDVKPSERKVSLPRNSCQLIGKVEQGKYQVDPRGPRVRCGNCSVLGHKSDACAKQFVPMEKRKCFRCNTMGHIAKYCMKASSSGNFRGGGAGVQ